MSKADKPQIEEEHIIREHRKWTRRLEGRRTAGRGNLVLTNCRLLFLHRVAPSAEVAANIKKLADAPTREVLDYAFDLNKANLQVPLSRVVGAKVVVLPALPLPRFCLSVLYLDARKRPCQANFQFERPFLDLLLHPQLVMDWTWARAINRTVRGN